MKKIKGVILGAVLAAVLLLPGCGSKVNHKTPEAVVKSLISAYQSQDEKAVKQCFGQEPDKDCGKEIKKEMDYNLRYFKAHEAKAVDFEKAESLGEFDKKNLVYVWYHYEVKINKETQKVPALSFYFVKKSDKKYYVVPAKDVTDEMSETSRKEYNKFVKTDDYKAYSKEYQEFIRKNPKYENSLQNKFKEISR